MQGEFKREGACVGTISVIRPNFSRLYPVCFMLASFAAFLLSFLCDYFIFCVV